MAVLNFLLSSSSNFLRLGALNIVCHRLISLSKSCAEVAVTIAKRLLIANVNLSGDLNNDLFLPALLQLRHTPDCDMSPTEIIFGLPCVMPFRLLIAYLSLPIVRYNVYGVKRGEPKKTLFVCELDAKTLHHPQTAAHYVPCIEVTACSSKFKLATTLVSGIEFEQSPRLWDSINMLSKWVDRDKSLNVVDGSFVSSLKR